MTPIDRRSTRTTACACRSPTSERMIRHAHVCGCHPPRQGRHPSARRHRDPVDDAALQRDGCCGSQASIAAIGLQSAPTVVERDGRYLLVAGRHRLEALKLLGVESVLVRVVDFDDVEARMWTIRENLHRAELTVLQRSRADRRICVSSPNRSGRRKVGQVAPHLTNQRRERSRSGRHAWPPANSA